MARDEHADGDDRREPATWLAFSRAAVLVAILSSVALYIHYLNPADSGFSGFAALHSGCEDVRRSGISYFGSPYLSMPLVGLVAYGSLFVLSMLRPFGK